MNFKKFATIAFKDIRLVFTDRAGLMILIAAPLLITFIIVAAFGNINTGDSPIKDIPVVVVNHDKGALLGPQQVNFGQNVTDSLSNVDNLLKVEMLTDENEARTRDPEAGTRRDLDSGGFLTGA
jgi:uncharacterized phage infection (PIP) family protein YhgE